jgi:SAM-dependent methyltransferase
MEQPVQGPEGAVEYGGVDVLEAMEEAVRYNAFLLDLLRNAAGPPRPGMRVLDFGAGIGTYARGLRDSGYAVECVELDPVLGRRLADDGFPCVPTPRGHAPESFDFVYSLNVLEHIPGDQDALTDLHSVSKQGGRLLLFVPAMPVLFSSFDEHVGHLRRYRREPLVRLAESAGFAVDRCRFVDSVGVAAGLAYKVFDRSGTLKPTSVRLYDRIFPLSRQADRLVDRWFGKDLLLTAHRP